MARVYFLFLGTLITAAGYGGTFLWTEHFRTLAGNETHTGWALGAAAVGTVVGVPLVGWFSANVGPARFAALGALTIAIGYFVLASLSELSALIGVVGFLVGLGWGIFYLAAPMSLSERVTDASRGFWFTRFGAFQMAGIGGGPVIASALATSLQMSTASAFQLLAACCLVAAALLWLYGQAAAPADGRPQAAAAAKPVNWVSSFPSLARTRALFPIIMVFLGACVFTGILTFQTSLVRGKGLDAELFYMVYAITVVAARFTLAPIVTRTDGDVTAIVLLVLMSLGVATMYVVDFGIIAHAASAVLLGLGYGLVYTVIQTQVVNDAPATLRNAALTWFVVAYFIGIFGFPVLGGWLIVTHGTVAFLSVVLVCALSELAIAIGRYSARRALRLRSNE